MFAYRDFAPVRSKSGWFRHHVEALDTALRDANAWIASSGVSVVRIETVVLPQMWEEGGTGPSDSETVAATNVGLGAVKWYQFFRVWYETADR